MRKQENDKYGNVTFGEATELLIDIIEQIVILDIVKREGKKEGAYKKKLERMYDGKGTYSEFATASCGSPQWYFALFFKTILEDKYKISPLAMIMVDSFTWQFFYSIRSHTPFEKSKKETMLFLARKQLFNLIYYNMMKGKHLSDNNISNISGDSIKEFFTDNYDKIFSDIENDFINTGKNFSSEIKEDWKIKHKDYPKLYKTVSLEEIIDELFDDGGIFYKELKDSYNFSISDLKMEKPKLYELLSSDRKVGNFTRLFKESIEEFIKNDFETLQIIVEEIPKSKIKYPYFYDYNKSQEPNFYLDDDILNWRKNDVYNPTWKVLEPILDFLLKEDKITYIQRLIGLYLRKNTQRAMKGIFDISYEDQEEIVNDIKKMIDGNNKPEEFYTENIFEFSEQINLIWLCLVYQYQNDFDPVKSDEIIKVIESKCTHSKKFFSPWLNARAKIFETSETLKEDKGVQDTIINGYKKAYDEGIAYAGEYLGQFLLEAILINRFCNPRQVKNTNDYHGYGYALEIFGQDKQKLFDLINETDNLQKDFFNILYSEFNPTGKIISQNFPSLHSIVDLKNEAIKINNKGLEYDKAGNYESAIQCFTGALLLNPVYVNAYSSRGNVYGKMGEQFTENALADFNMALLLDPKHENTLFNSGLLFFGNGQFEKAIKDFTEVININPKASDAYFGRGNCCKNIKYFDLAIEDYDKAIEINPRYAEAYYKRGVVYKLLGNVDKAQEDYCKAIQIEPEFFLKNGQEFFV
jgi:tetratricopeptide (TPR) repeat protein